MAEKREGEMTVREAGHLGGEAVKQKYGPEFFQKIGSQSWTAGNPNAKVPEITQEEMRRAQEIRQRIERGEDVSIHDVAFLGGLERVMLAHEGR